MSVLTKAEPAPVRWLPPDRTAVLLVAIGAAGFVLRFAGLRWGLPYSMHPDEPVILDIAQRLSFADLRPGFYIYPGFFVYQLMVVAKLAAAWGGDMPQLILTSRIVAASYGWMTIWFAYLLGNRLAGRSIGLLAAGLFALTGAATLHSHYAVTDTPMAALATAALWLTVRAWQRRSYRGMAVAAVVAGLAVSTKYSAAPAAVIPGLGFLALAARDRLALSRRAGGFVAMGAIAVAAFLITSPYTVLDFDTFVADMNVERSRQEEARAGDHVQPLVDAGWSERAAVSNAAAVIDDLGIPAVVLALLCTAAVAAALPAAGRAIAADAQPRGGTATGGGTARITALINEWDIVGWGLATAWIVLYFALMAPSAIGGQRYALPLYPVLTVFVAGGSLLFVGAVTPGPWGSLAPDGGRRLPPHAAGVWAILIVFAASPAAWNAYDTTAALRRPDTRLLAHDWAMANLPAGSVLAREYYAPFFHSSDGFRVVQPFTLTERSLAAYCEDGVEYLLLSSLNAARYFADDTERFAAARAWYEALDERTRVVETFAGVEMELHHPTIEVRRLFCGTG